MHQDFAIVFLKSDSGDYSSTVDGNTGDRHVAPLSPSDSECSTRLRISRRNNLTAWNNGDELVLAVAAQNENTIVVVHSVGPLIVEPWIDNPNVTALIWAGVGGTETGNALVDVLYGAVNPSGRLPYTMAKSASDYPATIVTGSTVIDYSEGCAVFPPIKRERFLTYPFLLSQQTFHRLPPLRRGEHRPAFRVWLRAELHEIHIRRPVDCRKHI